MSISIFDIMGPVMVGPSSSHTAGAVNLGRMAGEISGRPVNSVVFKLHGSSATTYRGHGTDRALLGGLLGFKPDDIRIREAFSQAREAGLKYEFQKVNIRGEHPNTVIFEIESDSERTKNLKANLKAKNNIISIQGSSIGGGEIIVTKINDYKVSLSGRLFTLWLVHRARPGMLGEITTLLGRENFNIASLNNDRDKSTGTASSIIKLDQKISNEAKEKIRNLDGVISFRCIPALK